ncbi:hypothetical protein AHAS_Ahas19G0252800 [Arachis hypogaea]
METGVIFYELEHPYVYKDPVLHSFYVVATEPRVRPVPVQQDGQAVPEPGPVIDDYIPNSPPVGLDMSIESLSTRSSNPFTIEPIGTSVVVSSQPSTVEQISLIGTAFVGDNSDSSPQSTSEIIVIFYNKDIKEIEIVDLTFEDDEDPEMDIEIVDLISDSD